MSEQPPLPGVSADTPESPTPLADDGMTWFFMPDGTRAQGRASCVVRGPRIEPCFILEHLLGWFSPDARTRLSIGMMVHRTREGERDALALRHGVKSAELDWCPCCGAKIRTRFEWEREASS